MDLKLRNLGKKTLIIALSVMMLLTGMVFTTSKVSAEENVSPDTTRYVTLEQLKSFGLDEGDTVAKIKFGNIPSNSTARTWYIAGVDTGNDNSLAVLSMSEFKSRAFDSSSYADSNFVKIGQTEYLDSNNKYFTDSEMLKMKETTVSSVTGKLYFADVASSNSYNNDETVIYLGSSNNIKISLDKIGDMQITGQCFWLRSAHGSSNILCAKPGKTFDVNGYGFPYPEVPAFDLDLSNVIFGSVASVTTNDGTISENIANTYTLRYMSLGTESAAISADKSNVKVSGATDGMYLIVQNMEQMLPQHLQ